MRTNNDTQTDEQLWAEVLDVLHANHHELTDDEVKALAGEPQRPLPYLSFKKVAAVFIAVAFLSGLTFATWRMVDKEPTENMLAGVPPTTDTSSGDTLIAFDNLRLDSILTVVAAHYERAVCFRDTVSAALRLSTVWNRSEPLAEFIAILNEFDGLQLTDERDTVFVQTHPSPSLVGRE